MSFMYKVCKFATFFIPLFVIVILAIGLFFKMSYMQIILVIVAFAIVCWIASIVTIIISSRIRKAMIDKFLPKLF